MLYFLDYTWFEKIIVKVITNNIYSQKKSIQYYIVLQLFLKTLSYPQPTTHNTIHHHYVSDFRRKIHVLYSFFFNKRTVNGQEYS